MPLEIFVYSARANRTVRLTGKARQVRMVAHGGSCFKITRFGPRNRFSQKSLVFPLGQNKSQPPGERTSRLRNLRTLPSTRGFQIIQARGSKSPASSFKRRDSHRSKALSDQNKCIFQHASVIDFCIQPKKANALFWAKKSLPSLH